MRCDNFKSNFARRLSNRYTSKSPIALKADSTMTLHLGSATELSSHKVSGDELLVTPAWLGPDL